MTIEYKVGGKDIEAISLPTRVYFDEQCRTLGTIYDVRTCPDEYFSSTLGDVYAEIGAQKFLGFSKLNGKFVGVEKNELLDFLKDFNVTDEFGFLIHRNLIRIFQIGDFQVYFPTAELLENQKMEKRK